MSISESERAFVLKTEKNRGAIRICEKKGLKKRGVKVLKKRRELDGLGEVGG